MTESKKSTKPPSLDDIPELLLTIEKKKGEKSAAAIKRIYELCDVGHKQNRVPMVCSGKWDVLTPLAACLTQESGDGGRHLACLALNNLSIPTENKRVMALGPAAKDVIGGLCNVISEDKQESYLCCICLMNLSFLEASITTILQHSPVADGDVPVKALENPDSLIRVLEKLLLDSSSTPKSGSGKSEGVRRRACGFFKNLTKSEDYAVNSEGIRWACALIKNLAKSEDNAKLLGKTNIPMCVAMTESKISTKLDDISELLLTIEKKKGEKSTAAIKRIYELCDVGHKQNRVPMVCSGKWDVLTPLAACLIQESGYGRHLACLALNNLSIPTENKRVMALGPAAKDVIGGLCNVIAEDKQQSHHCCICLMNLSVLDEASITTILQHSPVADGAVPVKALENPDSLIRVLEKLLSNSSSTLKGGSGKPAGVRRRACGFFKNLAKSKDNAGKSERLQWACGLIKNLAKSEDNAKLLGKTNIPMCVVDNLRNANTSPNCWTSNSLEDFSLFVVLNLAQWDASKDALIDAGAVEVIKSIMNEGDLQGLKATMACAFLEASWSDFPDGGQSANKSVSELMTNTVEKKGKDGQYAYGVFKLYTSTKAFRDLCLSAKKVEANSPMATPSSVALCFQIVSDLVLAATDEAEGGSKYVPDAMSAESSNYVPDAMSAEYSVQSIEAMLPTILAKEQYHRSVQSEKAAAEIVNMLYAYANVSGTSSKAQASARNSAEQIKSVSGNAGQILEIAHDLWTQYRKREGQPSDQFIN